MSECFVLHQPPPPGLFMTCFTGLYQLKIDQLKLEILTRTKLEN